MARRVRRSNRRPCCELRLELPGPRAADQVGVPGLRGHLGLVEAGEFLASV